MYQPQLIEVDPQRIKFNPLNPRKHGGSEFDRLKQSVREVGVVQLPTLRVLPGGFYEAIDGEGRVRSAQETHRNTMWAVSLGVVDDQDALTMLQAANTVRSFGFLAECRGVANLHRKGESGKSIAKKMGIPDTTIEYYIAMGYLPTPVLTAIQRDIIQGNERNIEWGFKTLYALLPLRQVIPGKDLQPRDARGIMLPSPPHEEIYDYREVQRAIEKIIQGEISSEEQLKVYVADRRREIFEQRFNEELRQRLEAEIIQTKQAIEEAYQQQLQGIQEQTAQRYEAQVNALRRQYEDLDQQYQKLVKDVARRPEIIAEREKQLQQKLKDAEAERNRFQSLQQQVQQEVQKTQQEARQAIQQQLSEAIKEQRKAMDKQLEQARADMEAYYLQKDQQRQLKAENSVRQAVAHGTELLTQTQQSFLHLTTPDFVRGIAWLPETEVGSLLAQIMAVQDTLTKALEAIRHGYSVEAEERVITTNG